MEIGGKNSIHAFSDCETQLRLKNQNILRNKHLSVEVRDFDLKG
jgi:hypothetical protein